MKTNRKQVAQDDELEVALGVECAWPMPRRDGSSPRPPRRIKPASVGQRVALRVMVLAAAVGLVL